MPLPTSRELREPLNKAAPGPWEVEELEQQLADCPPSVGFWVSGEDSRYIASEEVLSEDYDQTERDFTLIALAPQLAEEVIRLRDEINRVKHFCLDGCRVAEAEEARTTGETKALEQGKQVAYHVAYLELSAAQHGGDE